MAPRRQRFVPRGAIFPGPHVLQENRQPLGYGSVARPKKS